MYSVRGRTAATDATNTMAFVLWNGHSTQAIRVTSVIVVAQAAPSAGATLIWDRVNARGTPGSTVTPAIQHHSLRGVAPGSGVVLDLALYTANPGSFNTIGSDPFIATAGALAVYQGVPRWVGPGEGLGANAGGGILLPILEVTFVWEEDG